MRCTVYFSDFRYKMSSFQKKLLKAIKKNEIEEVRKVLLKNGLLSDSRGETEVHELLIYASYSDNSEIIKLLVNLLSYKVKEKKLIIAVINGNLQLAELLLKGGIKIKGSKWNFYSLVLCSSVLNMRNKTRKDMVALLVKYGLDTKIRDETDQTILHKFIEFVDQDDRGAVEIAEIIMNTGFLVNIDEAPTRGFSLLNWSIFCQNMSMISFFIKKGADVNKQPGKILVPLFIALMIDNNESFKSDLVYLLVSNGADINFKTTDGRTALHLECHRCNDKRISLLLHNGANISALDDHGNTPMSFLNPAENNYSNCLLTMIKEFSKMAFENKPISKKDMLLIQHMPMAKEYFKKCKNELRRMAETKFYGPHSYYSILKMKRNSKKFVNLTKNEKFISKLEENPSQFFYYQDDLERIFKEIISRKNDTLNLENLTLEN